MQTLAVGWFWSYGCTSSGTLTTPGIHQEGTYILNKARTEQRAIEHNLEKDQEEGRCCIGKKKKIGICLMFPLSRS